MRKPRDPFGRRGSGNQVPGCGKFSLHDDASRNLLDAESPPFGRGRKKAARNEPQRLSFVTCSGYQVVTFPFAKQCTQHLWRKGFTPSRSAGERLTYSHTELSQTGQRGDTFGSRRILLDLSGLSLSETRVRFGIHSV